MLEATSMLELRDVEVRFNLKRNGLFGAVPQLRAVDGVSLSVQQGQTMAIVGESGSGKTTLALAIARLVPVASGEIQMGDIDLLRLTGESLRTHRQNMQFIFQDPYSSLNPRLRAQDIVREPLDRLAIGSVDSRNQRVQEMFEQVGLRQDQLRLFPHQFSGGQRQRIGIARAIASRPSLVICDEPVSALDVSVQAQIINLLQDLQKKFRFSYLFISHDLSVVYHISDRVLVMYLGKIVEAATYKELYREPLHPYTQILMNSNPVIDPQGTSKTSSAIGELSQRSKPTTGCSFSDRCPMVTEICREKEPSLLSRGNQHAVACHLYLT